MSYLDKTPRDENGKPHGEWCFYDNFGVFYDNYIHGILHGLSKRCYYNDEIGYHGYYNKGVKINFWSRYEQKMYYLCLI